MQTLSCLSTYFVGAKIGHPEMTCWMVSLWCLHARHVSSSLVLYMCFLMYLVEIAFSWIAHIVLSVDLLSVEDFSQARLALLSMCGSLTLTRNCPCSFFSRMMLIRFVERFSFTTFFFNNGSGKKRREKST